MDVHQTKQAQFYSSYYAKQFCILVSMSLYSTREEKRKREQTRTVLPSDANTHHTLRMLREADESSPSFSKQV